MNRKKLLELFDRYSEDLYRFAVSYTGSPADAEDIVQSVFLKLMSKNVNLDVGCEKAYLMKVTANMCKNHLKSFHVRTSVSYDEKMQFIDTFNDKEMDVYDAVMKIPETNRVPLYLHFYEGYTYKEISKMLKISVSAVAMRISRGKDSLKQILEG